MHILDALKRCLSLTVDKMRFSKMSLAALVELLLDVSPVRVSVGTLSV